MFTQDKPINILKLIKKLDGNSDELELILKSLNEKKLAVVLTDFHLQLNVKITDGYAHLSFSKTDDYDSKISLPSSASLELLQQKIPNEKIKFYGNIFIIKQYLQLVIELNSYIEGVVTSLFPNLQIVNVKKGLVALHQNIMKTSENFNKDYQEYISFEKIKIIDKTTHEDFQKDVNDISEAVEELDQRVEKLENNKSENH